MRRWLLGLFCVVLSGAALADGQYAVSKRVQASMLVTGTIEVAPDGSVAKYTLDHTEKLPPAVTGLLAKALPVWKFEPVNLDGKPVNAKAPMGLRVVAKPVGKGNYSITVASSWFGNFNDASNEKNTSAEAFTYKHREQVPYPVEAAHANVSGTVYVLMKVGQDGKVIDAMAEQVDLRIVASDSQLAVWRRMLAHAAVQALRQDTFNVPTLGKDAGRPYWRARIPVDFVMDGAQSLVATRKPIYGQWRSYVPGPVQEPVWAEKHEPAGSADALPEDGSLLANTSLHLLTPLGGS